MTPKHRNPFYLDTVAGADVYAVPFWFLGLFSETEESKLPGVAVFIFGPAEGRQGRIVGGETVISALAEMVGSMSEEPESPCKIAVFTFPEGGAGTADWVRRNLSLGVIKGRAKAEVPADVVANLLEGCPDAPEGSDELLAALWPEIELVSGVDLLRKA